VTAPEVAALAELGAWADQLEAPGFAFGRWIVDDPELGKPSHLPWVEVLSDGERFLGAVRGLGFVVPFDWKGWLAGPEGSRYRADPTRIADAPAEDLVRLLTCIVRGDRFTEGELLAAFETGVLAAIARRAQVLALEGSA
jgi:hypothetical protein